MSETNLSILIKNMNPVLKPGEFVFVNGGVPPSEAFASVIEDEGLSLVVLKEVADRFNASYDLVARWITLTVNSSLEAVGLTAAFSSALAERGISCNVIAGLKHDHILVPKKDALSAMEALKELAQEAELATD